MQQAVRPRRQLLGRHMVAVGDHILDLNLDLDAASVEPHGRGRDLRGGQSAQAGTSHPIQRPLDLGPSRAGSVGKAASAAPAAAANFWDAPPTSDTVSGSDLKGPGGGAVSKKQMVIARGAAAPHFC